MEGVLTVLTDLRNFNNNGLDFLFPGLNLPSRYKSLTAWDFIDELTTNNDVTRHCRSCSLHNSVFVSGGFSSMPYATTLNFFSE